MPTNSGIHMRDPFVLVEDGVCYLYGTTGEGAWDAGCGFDVYRGVDLESWEGPFPIFRKTPDFWATKHFWAPEVHRYRGVHFLFASLKADGIPRGTQVFRAESPMGPFVPWSDGPVTPREWECLDGTLHVDREGQPWMVFCHEWVQCWDGEIHAMRLAPDLKSAAGEPVLLFRASEAPWVVQHDGVDGLVTDGPFLFEPETGGLGMLWSSFGSSGYAIGLALSDSGDLLGPWRQEEDPVFAQDGGHGMVFTDPSGGRRLAIHRPNLHPQERPVFLPFDR